MLKLVKYLDYSGNYAYAPPTLEAVIDTAEIQRVTPILPENSRSSYALVKIRFKDGSIMDVVGYVRDFVEIESGR